MPPQSSEAPPPGRLAQPRSFALLAPRWLRLLAAALLVALLALIGFNRATSAFGRLRTAQQIAQPAMGGPDLRAAIAACAEVDAALAEAAPLLPLASLAGLVPGERAQAWAQVPHLADAGRHGCQAVGAAGRLLAAVDAGPEGNAGMAVLAALRGDRRDLEAAATGLRAALDALDRVDVAALGAEERFAALIPHVAAVRNQQAELRAAADLAPRLPDLAARALGGDRARTYLLVGQNADEMRATGGFIGTLGLLTVADGRVAATDVRSSYLWDRPDAPKPPAPRPLERYMNFGGWYLRDANWWVDFRHTAAQLLLLWEREQGQADGIDGVIAIDQDALRLLLEAVGGVEVPELGGRVSADSVVAALDAARRGSDALRSYADYHLRKTEALSALHRALMHQVTEADGADLPRVLAALAQAAQQKHLLVWFRDPELQALVGDRGWDGRLEPGPGDFLGVVDTTISYGKVGPYIDKTVGYSRRADGAAVLELTYANRFEPQPGAPWDPLIDGTWWDWRARQFRKEQGAWLGYVRVLAPAGARVLEADGWDDAPTLSAEGPAAVMGAPLLVRPGQTRTVRLVYSNPTAPDAPLSLFRQPGTSGPLLLQQPPGHS
jgi:hypothetical protein